MANINDLIWASDWLIKETGYGLDACHDDMLESVDLQIGTVTGTNMLKLKISSVNHRYELHCKALESLSHHYSPTNYAIDVMEAEMIKSQGHESTKLTIHFSNQDDLVITCREVWLENLEKTAEQNGSSEPLTRPAGL